ncbi:MAG: hypothetical protein EZS28_039460 [Streblomastix strix]|uniref:RRM domain-containing protein n=1 Tax=Streblomastix strix TaxID=222440 RepID=A0A5J4U403_9EUKA|nr:MAG: hypothetical protein EZS28_039460 [Streblomastix strix]
MTLRITNLPANVTDVEVRALCEQFGEIQQISVKNGKTTVRFVSAATAARALTLLEGTIQFGQRITIEV